MDVNLENLIEKIKKEGVDQAQLKSDEIIAEAKKEANALVRAAKNEAGEIVEKAKVNAEKMRANGEMALQQAARDSELKLKESFMDLFDRVFKRQIAAALEPEFLSRLVLKTVETWAKGGQVEIQVNRSDLEVLQELLFAGISQELKESITLRASSAVTSGFRVELKGEKLYYDITDESITAVFMAHLNPNLREILDRADG